MDAEEVRLLQRRMLDAVQAVVAGTEWAPPTGGLITEAVVVMGWADAEGDNGVSHLRCGTTWGTEGLLVEALRQVEAAADCDHRDDE